MSYSQAVQHLGRPLISLATISTSINGQREQTALGTSWWAIVSRFFLHGLIVSTWVSRIPSIKETLGLSNGRLGLCLLGTAVGSMIAIPGAAWLVTHYGSKRVTAWSTVGFSLALLGPSLASNAFALFCALVLFGAMAGANDVSINAQGVALETALESPTMSRFHAMFSIGGMVGAGLGGLLAGHNVALVPHLAVASILFVALSLFTAPWLFEARDDVGRQSGDDVNRQSGKVRLRNIPSVLIMLAAIGLCVFLSEGAMADWTGVYLRQNLGTTAGFAAAGYAVFSGGMALFRLLGDSITTRIGPVRTVRGGALLAAAGLTLALTATHSPDQALLGFALTGAGLSVIVPLVFGAGGRVKGIPSGAGIATVSGFGYFGFLFGPPLIGFVAQQLSLRTALSIVVALSLLAAAFAGAVRPDDGG